MFILLASLGAESKIVNAQEDAFIVKSADHQVYSGSHMWVWVRTKDSATKRTQTDSSVRVSMRDRVRDRSAPI